MNADAGRELQKETRGTKMRKSAKRKGIELGILAF
jgi:hypothetical protein